MQVSISANRDLYNKIKGEYPMGDALRELMQDVIDKEVNEAVNETEKKTEEKMALKMLQGNESLSKIGAYTSLSKDEILALAKSIGITVVK